MTEPALTVSSIASICSGTVHPISSGDLLVRDLLIDSRILIHSEHCLFIALVSDRNDGHKFIPELYEKGVRCFLISKLPSTASQTDTSVALSPHHVSHVTQYPGASFILVPDTLAALQQLGAYHRRLFDIPVIGITGSNGKTIVKEWLFQLLSSDFQIIRSPKSYNSQIGVPLSVWKMSHDHELAIFEAGISRSGEMEHLEPIIRPTIGIFTNIGHAHDEYFENPRRKVEEKLKLFINSQTLIYCSDYSLITDCLNADAAYLHLKTFTWSRKNDADLKIVQVLTTDGQTLIRCDYRSEIFTFSIPFTDEASIENAINCFATELVLSELLAVGSRQSRVTRHASRYSALTPIAMRLELKEAINHCSLINDSYNSDIKSLSIALDFLNQQNQQKKKTIILSDILQTGRDKGELYREIASMLVSRNIERMVGIGRDLVRHADKFTMQKAFFTTTDDFLQHFPVSSFQNETILLKGARLFEFEKISQVLQQKAHETVMEINLDALIHNLNHFRALLHPGTRTMAMVKAFSYGSGSYEIANVLQFHRIDYLAVAYADEGVELRTSGIHMPIMVMSPEEQSLDTLLKYNLEPEIYNLHILNLLEDAIVRNQTSIQQEVRIHIKLDTGMHRLGFAKDELEPLIARLKLNPGLRVQSVFSHLAASEDPTEDDFTREQIRLFTEMSSRITRILDYPVLLHILNSAGIRRFPEAQFGMVRLGIGLYGVGSSVEEQSMLRNVSTLKSVITQIKHISAGDTIGYNRKGRAEKDTVIAIVPVGYADGLNRRLGNGRGALYIRGKPAPIMGNICMDLTMVDVTDRFTGPASRVPRHDFQDIREGEEVVIFGDLHPVAELAREIGTIPYEVLTGISRRVKRIYYYE
ncbi:MAG: bifunctional UDP-N-acetylmuramoyl-tripeptide:D-alanyl-D-alanine ligase/alanine racemase [Bacteroidetes bacterium]|nr:bifunctional UDP-N-acetylmuramoyl-tripeptide:D-alanyl-D-alanine ligase/alanine racemase [Bacteroidota bacterium]